MDQGDATIDAYEAGAARYLAGHRSDVPTVLAWIERFADELRAGGTVLEIGSGPGTDADRLERQGFRVLRSEATRAFADRLRALGHDVLDLDVRRDPLPDGLDGVFANAVLLHLDRDELAPALSRIAGALSNGGALAFSVKEGDGDEWHSRRLGLPRHFTYWRAEPLRAAVQDAGFVVRSLERARGETEDWLQVIARRTS